MEIVSPKALDRFLSKIDKTSSPIGCWLWMGALDTKGYGQFQDDHKREFVHRISYELFVGPIPLGKSILHKCDVGRCLNPDHLFPGTQKDNMVDCAAKERSGNFTLNRNQVSEIRALYEAGGVSQYQLARQYNVCQMTINRIINRLRWKHVS